MATCDKQKSLLLEIKHLASETIFKNEISFVNINILTC